MDIIIDGACVGNYWSLFFKVFHEAGFNAQLVTILGTGDLKDGIEAYKTLNKIIRDNSDILLKITRFDDLFSAKRLGKLGIIYHMQGAENLATDIENLDIHYELGLRVLQLAYNRRNYWCEGCLEMDQNIGLSNLGRKLINACNEKGVLIDGSHCSWGSVIESCELSDQPVICSHSNSYAIHPNKRNISDEVIWAVADSGGVIGVCGFPPFVSSERPLTLQHFINHIDHIDDLVGCEHISLGLDYFFEDFGEVNIQKMINLGVWDKESYFESGPWIWPSGMQDIRKIVPEIRKGLLDSGYSLSEIRKIMGRNLVRVFSSVWKH